MTKDLQNKIIKNLQRINVIPKSAGIFFPLVHIEGENSLIIEHIEDFGILAKVKYTKIILIKHEEKRLFFGIRNID
jgi:hypothetical protein